MGEVEAFLAAIEADPVEPLNWYALADWLQERGLPDCGLRGMPGNFVGQKPRHAHQKYYWCRKGATTWPTSLMTDDYMVPDAVWAYLEETTEESDYWHHYDTEAEAWAALGLACAGWAREHVAIIYGRGVAS
jgi:uncharacterized protein (TIGR02996 family)